MTDNIVCFRTVAARSPSMFRNAGFFVGKLFGNSESTASFGGDVNLFIVGRRSLQFTNVEIDCDRITDWDSLHTVFADAFGFPDFYGRNMNAWIDCLTSLDAPDDGMTSVHAPDSGCLVLTLNNLRPLAKRQPELYAAIVECSAFVSWRRIEANEPPVLVLSSST